MGTRAWFAGSVAAVLLVMCAEASAAGAVTFNKDVLPILQRNCQTCHRPGQVAPMSFLTYESTRPWAKAMKLQVTARQMPPWSADPRYGHFANDRSLKQSDIDTIVAWVDQGAAEGAAKDKPADIQWPDNGWQIKPDIIVNGPETKVPAHTKNDVPRNRRLFMLILSREVICNKSIQSGRPCQYGCSGSVGNGEGVLPVR